MNQIINELVESIREMQNRIDKTSKNEFVDSFE